MTKPIRADVSGETSDEPVTSLNEFDMSDMPGWKSVWILRSLVVPWEVSFTAVSRNVGCELTPKSTWKSFQKHRDTRSIQWKRLWKKAALRSLRSDWVPGPMVTACIQTEVGFPCVGAEYGAFRDVPSCLVSKMSTNHSLFGSLMVLNFGTNQC